MALQDLRKEFVDGMQDYHRLVMAQQLQVVARLSRVLPLHRRVILFFQSRLARAKAQWNFKRTFLPELRAKMLHGETVQEA